MAQIDQCYIHGYEPIPDGAYRVCGECGHVYVTEQDLVDATNGREQQAVLQGWLDAVTPWTSAEELYTCPLCTHDF